MAKEPRSLTNRQVIAQHNGVISGRYELTEAEQKIILLAIAQVDSKNDDEFITFKATIPELESKLNTTLHQGQLKETCRKLMQRVVYIENDQGDWKMFHWISRAEYFKGANTIEFKISDEMKPYLLKLKGNFTKLQIENAIKFNGKYTTRFYQFLMKLQNTTERKEKYELSELYKMLMLPKSMRTFGNFRLYVLDPSIDEINEKTDIKASYEIGRTGRKYTSITLSYITKKTEQTSKAREQKQKNQNLKKYNGKDFVYWRQLLKIEYVQINDEQNRIEVAYKEKDKLFRADFYSFKDLDDAIQKAAIQKEDMKTNPQKYQRVDRSEDFAKLFEKFAKKTN